MRSWPIRRKRLIERRTRLIKLVARYQAAVAEIEAELRSRGIEPKEYRSVRPYPLLGVRQGEMRHLCVAILRDAVNPLRMREIVAAVMAQKGMDGTDKRAGEAGNWSGGKRTRGNEAPRYNQDCRRQNQPERTA